MMGYKLQKKLFCDTCIGNRKTRYLGGIGRKAKEKIKQEMGKGNKREREREKG